jgi:hypothetical protein
VLMLFGFFLERVKALCHPQVPWDCTGVAWCARLNNPEPGRCYG